jgi:hypothetical protein
MKTIKTVLFILSGLILALLAIVTLFNPVHVPDDLTGGERTGYLAGIWAFKLLFGGLLGYVAYRSFRKAAN